MVMRMELMVTTIEHHIESLVLCLIFLLLAASAFFLKCAISISESAGDSRPEVIFVDRR